MRTKERSTSELEFVARAINRVVYGSKAELRWTESSEVRQARLREAGAALDAIASFRSAEASKAAEDQH